MHIRASRISPTTAFGLSRLARAPWREPAPLWLLCFVIGVCVSVFFLLSTKRKERIIQVLVLLLLLSFFKHKKKKMKRRTMKTQNLLKAISEECRSPQQRAFEMTYRGLPLYKLTREPTHLDDFDWITHSQLLLWRENETLLYIHNGRTRSYSYRHYFPNKNVQFRLHHGSRNERRRLQCTIYGNTDAAIVETATFFWSLKHAKKFDPRHDYALSLNRVQDFDIASALSHEQLAFILKANPSRRFAFSTGIWNAKHSWALATYTSRLKLNTVLNHPAATFAFDDNGTSFVNALQARQSSIGSMCMLFRPGKIPFSRPNLIRLFQLKGVIDKLDVYGFNKKNVLLPFSAQVKVLRYIIQSKHVQPKDFDALDIWTKDLNLCISFVKKDADSWAALVISFFNRVAKLGHFERFAFSMDIRQEITFEQVTRVTEALVGAIRANPHLSVLNLSHQYRIWDGDSHLQRILEAMEDHHAGLRELIIVRYPAWEDPTYSWLERLLSRNRKITVLDKSGQKCSNGSTIDKLYSLNKFYNGSAALMKESTLSLRPQLVTTVLAESASGNFQRTALLMSDHTDMLCELTGNKDCEIVSADESGLLIDDETASTPAFISSGPCRTDVSKRKTTMGQPTTPPRVTKKAARDHPRGDLIRSHY